MQDKELIEDDKELSDFEAWSKQLYRELFIIPYMNCIKELRVSHKVAINTLKINKEDKNFRTNSYKPVKSTDIEGR